MKKKTSKEIKTLNTIKVDITGPEGSGKSTIALEISLMFGKKGIDCELYNFDGESKNLAWVKKQETRMKSLKGRTYVLINDNQSGVQNKLKSDICNTCNKVKGIKRVDGGIACGVHCDKCWEDMLSECRNKSY